MALRDDCDEPRLANGRDVLLQVKAVGVCGSDVHYYKTGRIGSQVVQYPFRVGHEFAGEVLEVGSDVKRVQAGDRVAVDPAMPCGSCDQCLAGRKHTCRNLPFLGSPGQDGCLCERLVMPEECCFPFDERLSFEEGALAEPLSIGAYGAALAEPLPAESKTAILGAGPIGLCVLTALKARHPETKVYATDKIDARLAAAETLGAVWTGNPDRTDVVSDVQAREPLGMDAVIECCGQQDAVDQAVEILRPGGILVLVGIPEVDRISLEIDKARRKEIRLQNVRRQNECMQAAVDLLERGAVKSDVLITHRFPLEQTQEAIEQVANYRDGVIKAMIVA